MPPLITRFVPLLAGMPSLTLNTPFREQLIALSFFLTVIVLATLLIRVAVNSLLNACEFEQRLTLTQSFGVSLLWGLCCVIVLTMISGARELMTPGAWQQDGLTYTLKQSGQTEPSSPDLPTDPRKTLAAESRERLNALRTELLIYAVQHEGQFPATVEDSGFPADVWRISESIAGQFLYRPGLVYANVPQPLVIVPQILETQSVLMSNGTIIELPPEEVARLTEESDRPAEPEPESSAPSTVVEEE